MNHHLSQDQLSMWILGRASPDEQQHVRECSGCAAELARFQEPLSTFRSAMREWSERETVARITEMPPLSLQRNRFRIPTWGWAAAGLAVVMLASVPLYKQQTAILRESEAAEEAQRVMRAVNLHLSRTMPAPMEPILALMPTDEYVTEPGGKP
jgi:hypothetical protein